MSKNVPQKEDQLPEDEYDQWLQAEDSRAIYEMSLENESRDIDLGIEVGINQYSDADEHRRAYYAELLDEISEDQANQETDDIDAHINEHLAAKRERLLRIKSYRAKPKIIKAFEDNVHLFAKADESKHQEEDDFYKRLIFIAAFFTLPNRQDEMIDFLETRYQKNLSKFSRVESRWFLARDVGLSILPVFLAVLKLRIVKILTGLGLIKIMKYFF